MRDRERLHHLADEELMLRVARADADAFEVLYDRHADAAYALARRICGDRASADDVHQEAMLAVWRGAGRFRPELGSARAWLLTVVHHRAIDHVRARARATSRRQDDEAVAELLPAVDDTEATAVERAEREATHGLLATLPAEQRRVVALAFYGGLTHSEIAAACALPLGTVKGRMRLALGRLRRGLEERAAV